MLSIFEFTEYRRYLLAWIEDQGPSGYGIKGRLAEALAISSSLVSQVLKGEKAFTHDQASDLCDYLGLNEIETDYLHLLVEWDRAGHKRYKDKLKRKIHSLQEQSRRIGKRVPRQKELTDEQKAIFYSSWLYTGIFNLAAIPDFSRANAIADRLNLEPGVIMRVLRFLIEHGLCREVDGKISMGPASIHIDNDSPFVNKHHQNWRFSAIQNMERKHEEDLFFTSPMSLSKKAAAEIRALLPTVIQNIMKISGPSPSEVVACLNIDWFEY